MCVLEVVTGTEHVIPLRNVQTEAELRLDLAQKVLVSVVLVSIYILHL